MCLLCVFCVFPMNRRARVSYTISPRISTVLGNNIVTVSRLILCRAACRVLPRVCRVSVRVRILHPSRAYLNPIFITISL